MDDLRLLYENSFGTERWIFWISLCILYFIKYLILVLGIMTLLGFCIGPFLGLVFGIRQIKIKVKQYKKNKKDRKQLEDYRNSHNKQYFEKLDKLLQPHKKKKKY